jgi:hypothetical protein
MGAGRTFAGFISLEGMSIRSLAIGKAEPSSCLEHRK